MKNLKFTITAFLCLTVIALGYSQDIVLVTEAGDSILLNPNIPIGEQIEYNRSTYEGLIGILMKGIESLIVVVFVALTFFIPKLRDAKIPNLKRILPVVYSVLIGGGIAVTSDGNWINVIIEISTLVFGSTGLYSLLIKPLFGKTKDEPSTDVKNPPASDLPVAPSEQQSGPSFIE